MSGCTAELYDVLCDWLQAQHMLDVLFLQEVHWGLGKAETQWSINGWTFFVSPDPHNRYAGVAVVLSHRLVDPQDMTFCEWMPGRLLQVRAELPGLSIDFLCVYQWVRDREPKDLNEERRGKLWHCLGRALHSLPSRNLLLLAGDFNSGLSPNSNLIGRGLLRSAVDKPDSELVELLETHQLCALNTWGSARASKSATHRNGEHASQLDFILVRRTAADAAARRSGPVDLRWHLRQHTSTAQAFRDRVSVLVDAIDPSVSIGDTAAVKGGIRMMLPVGMICEVFTKWLICELPSASMSRSEFGLHAGHVLNHGEQFRELLQYFRAAFARDDSFCHSSSHPDLQLAVDEVEAAICTLKPHKAVPTHSPVAERSLSDAASASPSKRPQDLRPLGLQDPASKVYACLLRDKLEPYLLPWLADKPQYAYIPGRSIDEAVLRACRNCDAIRDKLRLSAVSVHSQRRGESRPKCVGGAALSLDLSRAFDALPRASLAESLRTAGVPASLCCAVLDVHEQCKYNIRHQQHAGTFSMEKGVRQGCVLSPLQKRRK
eukprot:s6462_g1.t1